MPPRRQGYVKLNGRDYALAPTRFAQGPAIRVRSAAKDLLADPRRRDIIPVQGGMPGEFWLWYDRFDGGVSPRHYRRPSGHQPLGGDLIPENRYGWLSLGSAALESLTWTAESQPVWAAFQESNELLIGNGQVVKLLPTTGTTVTEDVDFAATDADANTYNGQAIWERSNAEVALVGTGSHIFSRNSTWSNAAVATEFLAVGPDRIWKSYQSSGSYFVSNCLAGNDPLTAGNWSSGIRVGDSSKGVTGLVMLGDELLVGTTAGLFGVTPDGVVFNRTPELTWDATNGRGMGQAFGYVWYPAASPRSLYLYRDGILYIGQGPDNYSDRVLQAGTMTHVTQVGRWVYVVTSQSLDVSVWRARLRESSDEPGGILKWFIWKTGVATTRRMALALNKLTISDTNEPMLWLAYDGVATGYYMPMVGTDIPEYDSTEYLAYSVAAGFTDTAEFWFPEDDLGFPAANKLLRGAMVYGRQIDATRLVRVSGEFDQGTAFTALDLTAAATLTNFAGSNLSGKVLTDWYLTLFDAANGLTGPIVERFGLRFFVRPDNDLVFTLSLLLDDDVRHAQGNPIVQDAESQLAALLALSENVVTITFGSSAAGGYSCLVADDIKLFMVEDDRNKRVIYVAEVTLSVV